MKVSCGTSLLALAGLCVVNPGQVQGQGQGQEDGKGKGKGVGGCTPAFCLSIDWWFRWTFVDTFYPQGNVTEDDILMMLNESASYFKENFIQYQMGNTDLNESNVESLTMSTVYADCIIPTDVTVNTTDPGFWCPVHIELKHDGPLYGSVPPPVQRVSLRNLRTFENSVTVAAIQYYINTSLWDLGDDWYFVYEVQVGGSPDPLSRSSADHAITGAVFREELILTGVDELVESTTEEYRIITRKEEGDAKDKASTAAWDASSAFTTTPLGTIGTIGALLVLIWFV